MDPWRRRTAYYSAVLALLMLGYAVVYDYAMSTFEGGMMSPVVAAVMLTAAE